MKFRLKQRFLQLKHFLHFPLGSKFSLSAIETEGTNELSSKSKSLETSSCATSELHRGTPKYMRASERLSPLPYPSDSIWPRHEIKEAIIWSKSQETGNSLLHSKPKPDACTCIPAAPSATAGPAQHCLEPCQRPPGSPATPPPTTSSWWCSPSQHHLQLLEKPSQPLPGWLWGSSMNPRETWNSAGGEGQPLLPKQVLLELWCLRHRYLGPVCSSAVSCLASTEISTYQLHYTNPATWPGFPISLCMGTFFFKCYLWG